MHYCKRATRLCKIVAGFLIEPYMNELCLIAIEPCITAKEPYDSAKEPCIIAKEPHASATHLLDVRLSPT